MNMEKILSTKERVKILNSVIYSEDGMTVSVAAKETGLSKALVSNYFRILQMESILKRSGKKFTVQDNVCTKALKILLNLNYFDRELFRKYDFVRSAGLYGSFVKGTNTEASDIDIWIFVDKISEEKIARMSSDLRSVFRNIRPLYLTSEKIAQMKREESTFYHSLIFGSIIIYGDGIEGI